MTSSTLRFIWHKEYERTFFSYVEKKKKKERLLSKMLVKAPVIWEPIIVLVFAWGS